MKLDDIFLLNKTADDEMQKLEGAIKNLPNNFIEIKKRVDNGNGKGLICEIVKGIDGRDYCRIFAGKEYDICSITIPDGSSDIWKIPSDNKKTGRIFKMFLKCFENNLKYLQTITI